MNTKEFDALVNQTFAEINRLLIVKGGEYANAEDRLANFKRGAGLTGCTPLQVLFIYMSKHYDAVASFVQTSAKGEVRPSSEPIEGRLDDLINYCLLAKGLIAEARIAGMDAAKEAVERTATKAYNEPSTAAMKKQALQTPRPFNDPYVGVEAARAEHKPLIYGPTSAAFDKPLNLGPEHC